MNQNWTNPLHFCQNGFWDRDDFLVRNGFSARICFSAWNGFSPEILSCQKWLFGRNYCSAVYAFWPKIIWSNWNCFLARNVFLPNLIVKAYFSKHWKVWLAFNGWKLSGLFIKEFRVKVPQINYDSRNQLHHAANLNFGLMCKRVKHCSVLSTNFLFGSTDPKRNIIMKNYVALLNWHKNSNFFKIAVWRIDSMKWNYMDFTYNKNVFFIILIQ